MLFIIWKYNEVVHVANVMLYSQFFFDKAVQRVEIVECKKLTGLIAHGQAAIWRMLVAVDDVKKQI